MGDEAREIGAVTGGQGGTGSAGGSSDHGVHTEVALSSYGIEKPGSLSSLRFIEDDNLGEEGSDGGNLSRSHWPTEELEPRRHRRDE